MGRGSGTPRHLLQARVEGVVREGIAAGRYRGGRLPPERELAAQLGVSRVTVRRALAELERDGLITRLRGKGTFVHSTAPLPRTQTMRLGALHWMPLLRIPSGFYGDILRAAMVEAAGAGYAFLFSGVDRAGTINRFRRICEAGEVDGAILLGVAGRRLLRELSGFDLPMVLVDHRAPGLGFDSVSVDSRKAAVEAVRYLAALGHRRIAYLDWRRRARDTERLDGYRAGMAECGLEVESGWVVRLPRGGPDVGYRAMRTLLRRRTGVTAVLAHEAVMIPGILRAAREAGLHPPRDFSLITFGSAPLESEVVRRVTRFRFDRFEMGRQAVRRLLEVVREPALAPRDILLEWRFEQGGTCAPPSRAKRIGILQKEISSCG